MWLSAGDEVEVVGAAARGDELLAVVERTTPDVVLTDLAMPGLDGVAATRAPAPTGLGTAGTG
ncbi:response regulator [Streptomyces sp. NPDC086554]|uniref:response regulator transcription factor n=1 Tax=Streptomyces sp. NPDC086554 TaxID=3154864 RepID=UPI00342EFC45